MKRINVEKLRKLCPSLEQDCVDKIKEQCPDLDDLCLSQMDYMLVGRENFDPETILRPIRYYDEQYLQLCQEVIENGTWVLNERTGKRCLTSIGHFMKFDLSGTDAFPILTTKKMAYKPMIAEKLGFIRAVDNAKDFRDLGCKIWDANANGSRHWIENPNRKGLDDLGRIYGVQARKWKSPTGEEIDQLGNAVDKIIKRIDDRRLIVTHWNPAELDQMALPPCHLLYQFGIVDDYLHLSLYQRSADIPLGIPFNIASYSLLLKLVAEIAGLKVGTFSHTIHNAHIYEDQLEPLYTQLERLPKSSPRLILPKVKSLKCLETWVTVDDFTLCNYDPHPAIRFPFAE